MSEEEYYPSGTPPLVEAANIKLFKLLLTKSKENCENTFAIALLWINGRRRE